MVGNLCLMRTSKRKLGIVVASDFVTMPVKTSGIRKVAVLKVLLSCVLEQMAATA